MIQWEPIRSKLTGRELADTVDVKLSYLREQLAQKEAEIERLLAQ